MLKWTAIIIVVLIIAVIGYRLATVDATNARVAEDIRNNPDGERARRSMLITLEDGRMYPVNYLWEGNLVFMGIDGRWWRSFVGEGQPVQMLIRGQHLEGHAKTELDDQAYIDDVFSRLRPTVPAWLPDWLNGKLVVITLSADSQADRASVDQLPTPESEQ